MLGISARTLGELKLPYFCPRCFWIALKCKEEFPFQIPLPGIFSTIDAYSKHLIHNYFEAHNSLPDWFRCTAHTKLELVLADGSIQRFDAEEDFRNAVTFECFAHNNVKYLIVASRLKVCGTALLMKQMIAVIASEP